MTVDIFEMSKIIIDGEEQTIPIIYKKKYQSRKYQIKSKYGLCSDNFWNRWREQNGKCKTCEVILIDWMYPRERLILQNNNVLKYNYDFTRCNVDHDHSMKFYQKNEPNYVRGFLCIRCNTVYDTLNEESTYYVGDSIEVKNAIIKERKEFGITDRDPSLEVEDAIWKAYLKQNGGIVIV